jgi:hypothetical protein
VQNPSQEHHQYVKHVLRYLAGSSTKGLRYEPGHVGTGLEVHTDASYAEDKDDRKGTTGVIAMVNGTAVSWYSKKQPVTASSSTEAEIVATHTATQEVRWLRKLLREMNGEEMPTTTVFEDNTAAIQILNDGCKATSSTKHMEVRFFVAREAIQNGELQLKYIPTEYQLADALTKAPTRRMLETFVDGIGMCVTGEEAPREEGCWIAVQRDARY